MMRGIKPDRSTRDNRDYWDFVEGRRVVPHYIDLTTTSCIDDDDGTHALLPWAEYQKLVEETQKLKRVVCSLNALLCNKGEITLTREEWRFIAEELDEEDQ